jgi:hypothetical protein
MQRNVEIKFLNQRVLIDDTIHSLRSDDSDQGQNEPKILAGSDNTMVLH